MTDSAASIEEDPALVARIARFIKFCVVGGAGVFVNLGVANLVLLALPGAPDDAARLLVANAFGIVVSIFTNFLMNDAWTWGDRVKGDRRAWWRRLARYYASCSLAALVQVATAQGIMSWAIEPANLANLRIWGYAVAPSAAVLFGIACGVAVNFPVSHLWAFRDESEEDPFQ